MVGRKDAERSIHIDALSRRQIFDRARKIAEFFDGKGHGMRGLRVGRERERMFGLRERRPAKRQPGKLPGLKAHTRMTHWFHLQGPGIPTFRDYLVYYIRFAQQQERFE